MSWFALAGAITSVAAAMGYSPNEAPDAEELLKQVSELLNKSNMILEDRRAILGEDVYETFKGKYRIFHLEMARESQDQRAIHDQTPSQPDASREPRQDHARALLASVKEYQADILEASQSGPSVTAGTVQF